MQPDGGSGSSTEDCVSLQLVRASLQQCVSLHEITLAYAWAKSLEAQRTAARSRQQPPERSTPDSGRLPIEGRPIRGDTSKAKAAAAASSPFSGKTG